jgi:hypothetical protein
MLDKKQNDNYFNKTLYLPPGTYELEFYVDGEWRKKRIHRQVTATPSE